MRLDHPQDGRQPQPAAGELGGEERVEHPRRHLGRHPRPGVPHRKPGQTDGPKVTFGLLDELPADSAAVFVVELEAATPGTARAQVEARAEHLSQPLREEQAARVVGGN